MPTAIRAVPWLLAIAGLAIPLVGSAFAIWWLVLVWLVVLLLAWGIGGAPRTRSARIVAGVVLVPVLLIPLAFFGGWWLIPAVLAWLAIEIADREPRRAPGVAA